MEPVFERLEENFEYFNSLDDGVDVESVDYPTNKLDAMEPVFERLEENFEYFNSLDDGLYIVTGKDWFVTDMELVEAYKQGSKGRWGRHDGHLSDLAMTDAR